MRGFLLSDGREIIATSLREAAARARSMGAQMDDTVRDPETGETADVGERMDHTGQMSLGEGGE